MAPSLTSYSVGILGTGAIGGFLAAGFWKKGFPVNCIVKESSLDLLKLEGLHVHSTVIGAVHAHPNFSTSLTHAPSILFITTKSTDLLAALDRIVIAIPQKTLIIPLLNGLEHLDVLRKRFPEATVCAGTISIESKYVNPSTIDQPSPHASIELGINDENSIPLLEATRDKIRTIGIQCSVLRSEPEVLWRKLVRLNAIAITTAATQKPIGEIRSDTVWREKLVACVTEAVAVAKKDGISLSVDAVMKQIDNLPEALGTSLQRDVAAGKANELDSIPMAIVRRGQKFGISCPTILSLANQIKQVTK